jgi:hypothetical protein
MPLETAAGIWDLNSSNPPASDQLAQADDHLRLLKAALLATFPNINAAITAADEELNDLHDRSFQFADGTSVAPSVQVGAAGTQGLYKYATGKVGVAGRIVGDGTVPVGAAFMFPRVPGGLKSDGSAGGQYLELNGATYNTADYPDLALFYGAGGSTFVVDDMYTNGRFPRSRSASVAVGTTQANQNKAHTHAVSGSTDSQGDHGHTATSTVTDNGHFHFVAASENSVTTLSSSNYFSKSWSVVGDGAYQGQGTATAATLGKSSTETTGITVATTNATSGAHTHSVTGTAASDGGTEARPEAIAMIFAVKT